MVFIIKEFFFSFSFFTSSQHNLPLFAGNLAAKRASVSPLRKETFSFVSFFSFFYLWEKLSNCAVKLSLALRTMLPIMNVCAASHFGPLLPLKLRGCDSAESLSPSALRELARSLAPMGMKRKPVSRKIRESSIIPNSHSSGYLRICFPLITAGGASEALSLAPIACTRFAALSANAGPISD